MCCVGTKETTKKFIENYFKTRRVVIFYKIYRKKENCLSPQFFCSKYDLITKPGIVFAKTQRGEIKQGKVYNYMITTGIHVYTNINIAREKFRSYNTTTDCYLVRVGCHLNDLIVADNEQAVFTKVRMAHKEWKRIFNENKRKI